MSQLIQFYSALCLTVATALPSAGAPVSFSREVRPILSENCFYCHGVDANKRKAGLRLDVREAVITPSESGATAVVPGKAEASEIIRRLSSTDADDVMPPPDSHRVVTDEQKKLLSQWINEGAVYESHWAFVPPTRPAPPEVKQTAWPRNDIDRFILAKLESSGFSPSAEAEKETLIRRVTLDLTGLPPTPAEVDDFLADTAPDAYERVVERLMKSPHYGEKQALPWLDAARYADSNGFQQDGDTFQWIWRDWVVEALNKDMSFDQFSIEQLAGDLLPKPTQEQLIATAFNRNHLLNGEGGAIPEEQRFNILFDRVDTTATTWLGLTLACAQCHDHKYDPLTQKDYYGLMHVFNQVSEDGRVGGSGSKRIAPPFLDVPRPETTAHLADLAKRREAADAEGKVGEKFELALAAWKAGITPETTWKDAQRTLPSEITTVLRKPEKERTQKEIERFTKRCREIFQADFWPKISAGDAAVKKVQALMAEETAVKNEQLPRVMIMRDDKPRKSHILDRGEYLKPTSQVEWVTPVFLPKAPADGPKNRLAFAQWLFQPDHPLTSRVQANRLWQSFFGIGLVKTAEDLGVQSEVPLHQELIDWLAVEFRERGWSQKHIIRLIVTSATYRQSSKVQREAWQKDPENRLLSRGARFRLPSMVLRDVALGASGLLEKRIGGAPVYPYQPEGIWETLAITKERDFTYPQSKGADLYRRSLYTFWRRTVGPANMFDASARQTCKVKPNLTNTPLHALTTLNDPTWVEASRVLAAEALKASPEPQGQLTFAFRQVLARKPSPADLEQLMPMWERQLKIYTADPEAAAKVVAVGQSPQAEGLPLPAYASLTAVCLALFNLDEALTRE